MGKVKSLKEKKETDRGQGDGFMIQLGDAKAGSDILMSFHLLSDESNE